MTKSGWLVVPAALFACGDSVNVSDVPPAFFRVGAGERRVLSVEYDTLWSYGGVRDTILVAPDVLLAKPDGIYTLDVGTQQVVKFTFDGDVAWVWGRRGEGPGEVRRVHAMSLADNGVVIADSGNERLLWVDSAGHFQREASLRGGAEGFGMIDGMATLESGYVLESTSALWPILLPTGERQGSARTPWPELENMHFLQRVGMVVGTGGDEWVFSFLYGNGWIRFDGSVPMATHPFVEHSEFPRLVVRRSREGFTTRTSTRHETRPRRMTFDVKAVGDTLMILSSDARGQRMIDKYDKRSGEYQHSQPLAVNAYKIDFASGRVFVIDNMGLTPTIRALRVN